jgi:hypothetical protein
MADGWDAAAFAAVGLPPTSELELCLRVTAANGVVVAPGVKAERE